MKAVVQRVSKAAVEVDGETVGVIGRGLLVLAGWEDSDTAEDLDWMARKLVSLRIFGDNEGKMNLSVQDIAGEVMVVSQFTLHAGTKKGSRPSFIKAARPETATLQYRDFVSRVEELTGNSVPTGVFGAHMNVALVNDGPVTLIIDTKNKE